MSGDAETSSVASSRKMSRRKKPGSFVKGGRGACLGSLRSARIGANGHLMEATPILYSTIQGSTCPIRKTFAAAITSYDFNTWIALAFIHCPRVAVLRLTPSKRHFPGEGNGICYSTLVHT